MTESIRVLHVDDAPEVANLTGTLLEREDARFEVISESGAVKGLDRLVEEDIDCIVSDYDMPGMNGIEFLEAVRSEHPALPFVLFTGKGSEEVAGEAISRGVTDYLQKDSSREQYELLANRIANAVAQYRAEHRAAATEQRYSALFEHTNDAIAWIEFEGDSPIIRNVNPVFADLFVPPDGEAIGRDLDEIVATDERIEDARALSREVKAGDSMSDELTRDTVDGPREFLFQAVPIEDVQDEEITHSFAVYTDITERKERERELETREHALRSAYEIITTAETSLLEQIDALLAVVQEAIGTDYGTFSRVDIDDDRYVFEAVAAPPDADLEGGDTTSLDELPICERVVITEERLVLDDVEATAPDLVDPAWGISCYVGAPVIVEGETYGTFCFYDMDARVESFTDWETMFVELLSAWVGVELTKQRTRKRLADNG